MDASLILKHLRQISKRYNLDGSEVAAMHFEYDERKSESNLDKHGIDFEEAQELWNDPDMMQFDIEYSGEPRWGIISRYAGSCWVAICVSRDENIRIMSVRKATVKEMSFYDKSRDERRGIR